MPPTNRGAFNEAPSARGRWMVSTGPGPSRPQAFPAASTNSSSPSSGGSDLLVREGGAGGCAAVTVTLVAVVDADIPLRPNRLRLAGSEAPSPTSRLAPRSPGALPSLPPLRCRTRKNGLNHRSSKSTNQCFFLCSLSCPLISASSSSSLPSSPCAARYGLSSSDDSEPPSSTPVRISSHLIAGVTNEPRTSTETTHTARVVDRIADSVASEAESWKARAKAMAPRRPARNSIFWYFGGIGSCRSKDSGAVGEEAKMVARTERDAGGGVGSEEAENRLISCANGMTESHRARRRTRRV